MEKQSRERFNESFTKEKYETLLQEIEAEFPGQLDFKIAESPLFIDSQLKIKLLEVSNHIIDFILKPDFKQITTKAIPEKWIVPGENLYPDMLAIDFGIIENEMGELEPRLIELQGFPSLFGFQQYLASKYRKHFNIPRNFSEYFSGFNALRYIELLKKTILDGHKPEEVILTDIHPDKQKTKLDFAITSSILDISIISVSEIFQEGENLYYLKNKEKQYIKRIYNRIIFDELEQNYPELKLNFNLKDNLAVTWVSHPNWYYRISKFLLPLLKHKYIPQSLLIKDYQNQNLESYVLKPIQSFAGQGVNLNPDKEDLTNITQKENYILQEKVEYATFIKNVDNKGIKAEIRLLYLWPKGRKRPILTTNITRLSQGEMVGVRHNKDFSWVGASTTFIEVS